MERYGLRKRRKCSEKRNDWKARLEEEDNRQGDERVRPFMREGKTRRNILPDWNEEEERMHKMECKIGRAPYISLSVVCPGKVQVCRT